jgi:hypothetical protein
MAYVSSNAPLPQNGMQAPPAAAVDRSNAMIALAACVSRNGRMRAYSTLPTYRSLASVSPQVAASAARLLPQSELARRSVLTGSMPVFYDQPSKPVTLPSGATAVSVSRTGGNYHFVTPEVVPLSHISEEVAACTGVSTGQGQVMELPQRVIMPQRLGARERALVVQGRGGVAGYVPRWGDAGSGGRVSVAATGGVMGWVRGNPWLAFGLLGGLVAFDAFVWSPRMQRAHGAK